MIKTLTLLLCSLPAAAAVNSPLEADFPAGYWERESMYYGSAATAYNISLAVKEPGEARAQVEGLFKSAKATLTGFTDQTPNLAAGAYSRLSPEYAGMARVRLAYTLTYKLPLAKAPELAKQVIGLGRLLSYSTNTPYSTGQQRELDEKIAWIEKEQKAAGVHLKTMPVSRALLDAKLKGLRQAKDMIKASEGAATITIQLQIEEAEKAEGKEGGQGRS